MQLDQACPVMNGYFLGSDRAEQSGLMINWPGHDDMWGDRLPRLQQAVALLVRTLAEHAPILVVAEASLASEVRLACQNRCSILAVEAAADQPGLHGPWFLTDGTNGHAMLTWQGSKQRQANAHAAAFQTQIFEAPLNLDGGSVISNGAGTIVASQSALLASDHNPELTMQQAEERLALFLGARHVIWLGGGIAAQNDSLNGAVRFASSHQCFVASAAEGEADAMRLDAMALQLAAEHDADHTPIEVTRLGARSGYGPLSALDYIQTPNLVLVASAAQQIDFAQMERALGKPVQEIAVDPALEVLGGLRAIVQPMPPAAFIPQH